MNTIVPLEPHNAPTVLDLCQRRLSPQAASRFLPLARAFLDPSAAAASGLVIGGGELFSRKLQLLYFLMRVAERSNSSPSGQVRLASIVYEIFV